MKHFLSTEDMNQLQISEILQLADSFSAVLDRQMPKVPALRGKTVVMLFFEDSTRTRVSFDLAAKRLSADVVNFSASTSSTKKGESIRDTVETIDSMGVDAVVVRHGSSGMAKRITEWTSAKVVNAGDGWHAHPTQAMLDCYTVASHRREKGAVNPFDFDGMNVAICGDVRHSRVARSNVDAFTKMGAKVTLVGPATFLPAQVAEWPVETCNSLDSIVGDLDVAYLLRIQKERLQGVSIPSDREYRRVYGLTTERAASLKPDALIMHPGPMNRGVELDSDVADDRRAVVTNQVANGVPIRMAVLYRLLGPGTFDGSRAPDEAVSALTADASSTETSVTDIEVVQR